MESSNRDASHRADKLSNCVFHLRVRVRILYPPSYLLCCSLQAHHRLRNLDISYKPAPKAGSSPLEQRAAIDGSNAENTATKRPIGKNEPQATVWLTLADRDGQHDNPKGEDVDEKGQSTVQVSEQLVQAAIGAWTHSDDTTLNTNATPTPPRLFLRRMSTASDWQRETLTQILAISRAHDASEAMRSAPNQTFNEVNNKTPSTPCPIIRRCTPPSTPTGPNSSGRSLLSASASPDPSFASAGVLPSSPASSPSFFPGKEWKSKYPCYLWFATKLIHSKDLHAPSTNGDGQLRPQHIFVYNSARG